MSTTAHKSRGHAKLSPSAAGRFIACPGSVAMESGMPDTSSAAANEGTAAHELASWALMMGRDPADMLGRVIDINANTDALRFLMPGAETDDTRWPVTDEMVEHVKTYVDYVVLLGGERAIEQKMSMEHVHPEIWGTGDAVVYVEAEKHLHIVDLKYGRGVVVEAKGNPQLTLYASGAVKIFDNRDIETVTATIVQPRAPHDEGPIRSVTFSIEDLQESEAAIRECAERAVDAMRTFVSEATTPALKKQMEKWHAEYLEAGDHCRFCKVGATCPTRAEKALTDAQAEFAEDGEMTLPEPAKMSAKELAELLGKARQIQHWVNAVEAHANAEALEGRVPEGFKLVKKRATRKWIDEDSLLAAAPMLLSVNRDAMFGAPKLLSPAQLEKIISKDERASLAGFITAVSSGMNLVPASDGRKNAKPSAKDEFA